MLQKTARSQGKNNAYMQKYRAKTYTELDLNERGKLEISPPQKKMKAKEMI